ncbi:hypothetical protein [Acidovorax sp.]|jgi:hypothetical protein|uniref:hypothetical protein n=1 Tax=Acidovorax sp. TaxID=1872122 RepID=UPI00391FC592
MKLIQTLFILALSLVLAACSGAPSDSDVRAVTSQSEKQMDQQLAPLGLKWSDVFETEVKVKNKAKQDDGRWLVEADTTITAKKDMKELPENAQFTVFSLFGDIKKGQPIGGGAVTTKFYMQKGDNGWMAVR